MLRRVPASERCRPAAATWPAARMPRRYSSSVFGVPLYESRAVRLETAVLLRYRRSIPPYHRCSPGGRELDPPPTPARYADTLSPQVTGLCGGLVGGGLVGLRSDCASQDEERMTTWRSRSTNVRKVEQPQRSRRGDHAATAEVGTLATGVAYPWLQRLLRGSLSWPQPRLERLRRV